MNTAQPAPEGATDAELDGLIRQMMTAAPHAESVSQHARTILRARLASESAALRARCERLEGALGRVDVEVRQSKATLYIDGVKICALPTHLDGNPAESEKLIEWAGIARALAQPEDGK